MVSRPLDDDQPRDHEVAEFVGEPTRDLGAWRWLWTADRTFPVRSHRGLLGWLLVAGKRLLRPLARGATADLWDRQRAFNLILLEHVTEMQRELRRIERDRVDPIEARLPPLEHRAAHLEAFLREGLVELMRYDDALYARVDQKLDAYRRQSRELQALLGAALERLPREGGVAAAGEDAPVAGAGAPVNGPESAETLRRAVDDSLYLELERRHRGTEEEIRGRLEIYLPLLAGRRAVADLGCGRGEALALFAAHGIGAVGADASPEMVRRCRERGLDAVEQDLLGFLGGRRPSSLDAVVSFHVAEHLPAAAVERLVRSAWRALEPGGVLILETPNPLSISVAASQFWRDPTHRRPLHPDALRLFAEEAGFDPVEIRWLHPFPASERLPEIELDGLDAAARELAHRINLLRDRLDEALYGHQDYALIARRP